MSPKILILDALESRLNGALEYPIFSFLYISEYVLNLDENSSAPFGILEVLMILISAFITNSWE
jgi:Na+/serine symporter